jgi:sodium-dependent phosphate cotransporter
VLLLFWCSRLFLAPAEFFDKSWDGAGIGRILLAPLCPLAWVLHTVGQVFRGLFLLFAAFRDDPRVFRRAVVIAVLLYIFICGIKLMGGGCKAMKEQPFVHDLLTTTKNPFIGLLVGILVTSIIQSSSATTSIVVALVAEGTLGVGAAIPIVMGANIGTTVTNTLVSMGYVMRRDEFRRAISGAIVHDLFNVLVVLVLLPLELGFGILQKIATWLTTQLPQGSGGVDVKAFNPLKRILDPTLNLIYEVLGKPKEPGWVAGIVIVLGLALIFLALMMLVRVLRSMMLGRAEAFITRVLGKSGWMGILIGILVTAMVQSSSITTSVLVPMAAAGIVTVPQIFPITIGANIGTTVTALIASLAGGKFGLNGVTIACVHCLFNLFGMLLFYPAPALRRIPPALATKVATVAANSRKMALVYIFLLFFGVPGLMIFLYRLF